MRISIVCPVYNEERYISTCIESIVSSDYSKELIELIFVDGNSSDSTRRIIESYILRYPFIRLLDNPSRTVPYALNIGIRNASGDIVFRIDAHSFYPKNYFSALVKALIDNNADNVGARCVSVVINKTVVSSSIAKVMSDRFGVGNSVFRTGAKEIKEVDTVPFGCWRREIFERIGYFDERLTRNQDIEFNKRLKRNNGKILLIPDVLCYYIPRETYLGLWKNRFQTGYWVIKTSVLTNTFKNLGLRHFVPLVFLIVLLGSFLFSFITFLSFLLFVGVLIAYITTITTRSIVLSDHEAPVLNLIFAFIVLHISYGAGSLVSICKMMINKQ